MHGAHSTHKRITSCSSTNHNDERASQASPGTHSGCPVQLPAIKGQLVIFCFFHLSYSFHKRAHLFSSVLSSHCHKRILLGFTLAPGTKLYDKWAIMHCVSFKNVLPNLFRLVDKCPGRMSARAGGRCRHLGTYIYLARLSATFTTGTYAELASWASRAY